jgi:D-alanine-D-alanine ligase
MRLAIAYNIKKDVEEEGFPEDFYAEWDDMDTIESVRDALAQRHEAVELIEADEGAYEKLRELKPELVFNMAEGIFGESRESHLPSIMEMLGIPYTGSAPLTLALCLNKARAKQVLSQSAIPNPGFFVFESPSDNIDRAGGGAAFPPIVKPLYEGSSKGIRDDSIVRTPEELRRKVRAVVEDYAQPALVEEYLEGREFTVALLGNGESLKALPPVEINYSALPAGVNPIYSYEAKWILDRPETPLDIFTCPAEVDGELERMITDTAKGAFNALGVRDWCRIDLRLDSKGTPNVLELNPLPGILPDPKQNSCFPKAARADGMDFVTLVNTVVEVARKRYGI